MIVEIVVYNFESAIQAKEGGADRIELCNSPGDGGTTPSIGMIETIRSQINIEVSVMIRPRGGDFLYSDEEYIIMKHDIMACKRAGADGVVLGILNPSGEIDKDRCKELIQIAKPMTVTFHRAFDMTKDLSLSLEDCIDCGFDRILTSGGKLKAIEGLSAIAQLNTQANGRIEIMPGSGITTANALQIVSETKVKQIHLSASATRPSSMSFQNNAIIGMGSNAGSEFQVKTVNPEIIQQIKKITAHL